MKRIVFLHGRAQEGHDPNQLQQTWEVALARGLKKAGKPPLPDDVKIEFPYYGNRLKALVDQVNSPLISGILLRGDDQVQAGHEELRVAMLAEMATGKKLPDSSIQKNFDGQVLERGVQNWKWVQAILRTLDGTPAGARLLDLVTRDVSVYLTYRGLRSQINRLVSDQIPPGASVFVLHSLGTVVGYNVLRERTDLQAPLLVTVGSPLGMTSVQTHLDPPLVRPGKPEAWLNARDPEDVVALFPLDGTRFHVNPEVENKSDVDNTTDNQHGIDGYLDDSVVAARIFDAVMKM
jgi:hypothetical protein